MLHTSLRFDDRWLEKAQGNAEARIEVGQSSNCQLATSNCYTEHMLAPYAVRVEQSRGRRYPEPPHPYRNDYQRDRDRVIHARAFRRLEDKTQVFTGRLSDHFRNRLTHTLEVSQIS